MDGTSSFTRRTGLPVRAGRQGLLEAAFDLEELYPGRVLTYQQFIGVYALALRPDASCAATLNASTPSMRLRVSLSDGPVLDGCCEIFCRRVLGRPGRLARFSAFAETPVESGFGKRYVQGRVCRVVSVDGGRVAIGARGEVGLHHLWDAFARTALQKPVRIGREVKILERRV